MKGEHWIIFFHRQLVWFVKMAVKGGFVGDDDIVAGSDGLLKDVHGGHHRDSDAGYGSVGISRFECVDGFLLPGHADVEFDAVDHLPSRDSACGRSLY
jgi:hypothetical protein